MKVVQAKKNKSSRRGKTMKCTSCGNEISMQVTCCPECGHEQAVEQLVQQLVEQPMQLSKKNPSHKLMLGIVTVFIVVIVVLVGLKMNLDKDKMRAKEIVVYWNEDAEMYRQLSGEQFVKIEDNFSEYKIDEDYKDIYTLTGEQYLHYTSETGDKNLIAKDVETFAIDKNGDTIIYYANYWNDGGTLNYKKKGELPIVICLGNITIGGISRNGKYVAYCMYNQEGGMDLYKWHLGTLPAKVVDHVADLISILDNGELLYIDEEANFIKLNSGGAKEVIKEKVAYVKRSMDEKTYYIVSEANELSIYQGNKCIAPLPADTQVLNISTIMDLEEKEYLEVNVEERDYLVLPNNKPIEIKEHMYSRYLGGNYSFTEKGKNLYYIDDGNRLRVIALNENGIQFENIVSADVAWFEVIPNSNNVYFSCSNGDIYHYTYQGSKVVIIPGEGDEGIQLDNGGNIYYIDDQENIYQVNKQGIGELILKDFKWWTKGMSGPLYVVNKAGELYLISSDGEKKMIATSVTDVAVLGNFNQEEKDNQRDNNIFWMF